jgi:hypothetical protein
MNHVPTAAHQAGSEATARNILQPSVAVGMMIQPMPAEKMDPTIQCAARPTMYLPLCVQRQQYLKLLFSSSK